MTELSIQDQIFSKLKISLEGQKAQAAFCCGGSSKISDDLSRPDIRLKEAPPVILHWTSPDAKSIHEIVFSRDASSTEEFNSKVQYLADSCQPASFGKEGKDVFDESYRKAAKLDSTCFTTNFHPHDYGILQDIERILLPAFEKGLQADSTIFVQAELYKLNIYSGPGGKFKAHVDTPRAQNQFGSLVVSLPSAHQGGALAIRHNNREMSFDWSNENPKAIEWAAFFSDCEHEVANLTSGHRVTLTYNLYTMSTAMPKPMRSTEAESFPLYWEMRAALSNKDFLPKGGTIGFFCNHFYAQNSGESPEVLPQALKGIDMIVHAVSNALHLPIGIAPILGNPRRVYLGYDDDEQEEEVEEDEEEEDDDDEESVTDGEGGATELAQFSQQQTEQSRTGSAKSSPVPSQQVPENPRENKKIRYSHQTAKSMDNSHRKFEKRSTLVGRAFHKFRSYDQAVDDRDEFVSDMWPHDRESIYWVTQAQQKEVAMAFATYGNEPGMDCEYSAAALIVDIPAWGKQREVF